MMTPLGKSFPNSGVFDEDNILFQMYTLKEKIGHDKKKIYWKHRKHTHIVTSDTFVLYCIVCTVSFNLNLNPQRTL